MKQNSIFCGVGPSPAQLFFLFFLVHWLSKNKDVCLRARFVCQVSHNASFVWTDPDPVMRSENVYQQCALNTRPLTSAHWSGDANCFVFKMRVSTAWCDGLESDRLGAGLNASCLFPLAVLFCRRFRWVAVKIIYRRGLFSPASSSFFSARTFSSVQTKRSHPALEARCQRSFHISATDQSGLA